MTYRPHLSNEHVSGMIRTKEDAPALGSLQRSSVRTNRHHAAGPKPANLYAVCGWSRLRRRCRRDAYRPPGGSSVLPPGPGASGWPGGPSRPAPTSPEHGTLGRSAGHSQSTCGRQGRDLHTDTRITEGIQMASCSNNENQSGSAQLMPNCNRLVKNPRGVGLRLTSIE